MAYTVFLSFKETLCQECKLRETIHKRSERIIVAIFSLLLMSWWCRDGPRQSAAMVMTYLLRNSSVSVPPFSSWWRHQMGTCSTLLALWAGNSPSTSEFPSQKPVIRSFDVFFDLRLWTNCWVNNWDASDLRHHRAHYDVTVMLQTTENPCERGQYHVSWCPDSCLRQIISSHDIDLEKSKFLDSESQLLFQCRWMISVVDVNLCFFQKSSVSKNVNPPDTVTGILLENWVSSIAADALAPCVPRLSAANMLAMQRTNSAVNIISTSRQGKRKQVP